MSWTRDDVGDLTGRRALVTGGTEALGSAVTAALEAHGAEIVPTDSLDLADLSAIRRFAADASRHGPLHLLVNAAEVRGTAYRRTGDGFEQHLGVNHLGHFALTGLLLPVLVSADDARVVTVSSLAHRMARQAPLQDPRMHPGRYNRWAAYAESKVANLLFTHELHRRAREAGLRLRAMAAHPGYLRGRPRPGVLGAATGVIGQNPEKASWPVLMAATAPLPGATYVGPGGFGETHGPPAVAWTSRLARDPVAAGALWELSQHATGVVYP